MARKPTNKVHIERPGEMDDATRSSLLAGITQAAQTSPVYAKNPMIQSLLASLVKTEASIKPAADLVAKDKAQLDIDATLADNIRSKFDKDLETLHTPLQLGQDQSAWCTPVLVTFP